MRFEAVGKILDNAPDEWVKLTTHRLDIYDESQAKTQFLERLSALDEHDGYTANALTVLPTAYDYIRLGHPLSCVLEWVLGALNGVSANHVISFASKTMPMLAVLRTETLAGRTTYVYYTGESEPLIDIPRLRNIYGYRFELNRVESASEVTNHEDGKVMFVTDSPFAAPLDTNSNIDVTVNRHSNYGSVLFVQVKDAAKAAELASRVQHVRRRETIAMTPPIAQLLLREIIGRESSSTERIEGLSESAVFRCIRENTGCATLPLVGSSGLSVQYAVLMGLVEYAMTEHPGKPICVLVPPNCYGGTNDQTRRVAALIPEVAIVDMLVDGGKDMVTSLDSALDYVAGQGGVPLVLAEIPTNPRVEVPDMSSLAAVLTAPRLTPAGKPAVAPVFMVDQTFCPNVELLGDSSEIVAVQTISFSSGSKFPSGGTCVAGYCASNSAGEALLPFIGAHLVLSDNTAADHQLDTLAECMPSMRVRIQQAYENARAFVAHIRKTLPEAKINFVSDDLADLGFTPSVFSLDLPIRIGTRTAGHDGEEDEARKRMQNVQLIEHMIARNPDLCLHCVSYGQLKASYWTIPATSTQGTTRESDKDYIVRVSLSPDVDVPRLNQAFTDFCYPPKLGQE